MTDTQTLDTLTSDVSRLTKSVSQISSWINRVEQLGLVPKGTWDLSQKDVLRGRFLEEIREVERLLLTIQSPDLEGLLIEKLQRLEFSLSSLKNQGNET